MAFALITMKPNQFPHKGGSELNHMLIEATSIVYSVHFKGWRPKAVAVAYP